MPLELHPKIEPLPCPFCGGVDYDLLQDGETDVCVMCDNCQAQGPATRIGCRDEDDGEIDLEFEAIELWNKRVGCAMGLECPEHSHSVHGAEAEELRQALEKMAGEFEGVEVEGEDISARISALLDDIDARDSLSYVEQSKRAAGAQ
jgi:hypothetical protein